MTEEWLPITDFPDYFVSNQGRVKSMKSKSGSIILKPWLARGYPTVSLSKDGVLHKFQVHTLVLTAFVGPSEGRFCLHLDNSRTNNCLDNITWGTHEENMEQMVNEGRSYKLSLRKLTPEQVREIRASPLSCVKLGRIYHCGHTQIHRIKRRLTYKDVV